MQIKQALTEAIVRFKEAKIESACLDARILLSHVLNQPAEYLLARNNDKLTNNEQKNFFTLIKRRLALEPIAYIVGYKEFYGRIFAVNKKVLIPRPDTEILIEAILSFPHVNKSELSILDLGTGSGCIIISLLLEIAFSSAIAIDICNEALLIAKRNAFFHKVDSKLELIYSHWFDNLTPKKFDIIVSNPPYIAEADRDLVSKETINYEPAIALFAEQNGLNAYHSIAASAKDFLKKEGKLFIEVGFNQANIVSQIFISQGYRIEQIYKDIAKHSRVISIALES